MSTTETKAESKYVLGIDSLRALAVWAVIFYHLNNNFLPGGFVGVDIFFAISGYVITKSLLEHRSKNFFQFFTGFYRRRFVRIAPALFFYLIATGLLASYFIPKASLSGGIFPTATWAIFGASNIQLVLTSDGYFAERMDFNPFIQTWSLGVEEQFYLFYPILIALLVFAIQRSYKQLKNFALAILIAVSIGSVVLSAWQTENDSLSAFYLLPARFWELAAGGLLFLLVSRSDRFNRLSLAWKRTNLALGLVLVGLSLVFANTNEFPYFWAIPPVIGTLLLLNTANDSVGRPTSLFGKLATGRPIVYFGKISYSLYLWHWGIFVLMRWTIGLSYWWHYLIGVTLTVIAAAISYKFVETPIRTGKLVKRQPDWRVITAGTLAAVLVFFTVDFSKAEYMRRSAAVSDPQFTDRKATISILNKIPSFTYGQGQNLIFVGDSHAGHYKYMGHWIASKTGAEFQSIIHVGCSYVNLQSGVDSRQSRCLSEDKVTAELLQIAKPNDIVVLSSFSTPRVATLDAAVDKTKLLATLTTDEQWARRAERVQSSIPLIKTLQEAGLHVVLAAPTPVFVTPADRCSRWFNKMNPICSAGFKEDKKFEANLRAPVMKSYRALAKATGATLWDPFPLLCPEEKYCYSEANGRYLYVDQHHLSSNGNLLLLNSFLDLTKQLWSN